MLGSGGIIETLTLDNSHFGNDALTLNFGIKYRYIMPTLWYSNGVFAGAGSMGMLRLV